MLLRAGVGREERAFPVQQQKALLHIIRQGGKFLLTLVQLFKLIRNGQSLLLDPTNKGRQLRIGSDLLRMIQIHLIDGLDDLICRPKGQNTGQGQYQYKHPDNRADGRQRSPYSADRQ